MEFSNILKSIKYTEPYLLICHNFGRGLLALRSSKNEPRLTESRSTTCYKINEDLLEMETRTNIFFSAESYMIQWTFGYTKELDGDPLEETMFYYWKGSHAPRGISPLPPEFENNRDEPIVERICQWSEPAVFFHLFPQKLVVLNGKAANFNPNVPHLFIVRGELGLEIHLFEVPCYRKNLRSRSIFLLVAPAKRKILNWHGSAVTVEYCKLINDLELDNTLRRVDTTWSNFDTLDLREDSDAIFSEQLEPNTGDYFRMDNEVSFTPQLFYLCSFEGKFFVTSIEYPLRSKYHIAPFPFLQSHLYSADQPALFILDNHNVIWIWKGLMVAECDADKFKRESEYAEELANQFAKERGSELGFSISVKNVEAGLEPIDFTNIFPNWIEK